jgi:magnesium transporter
VAENVATASARSRTPKPRARKRRKRVGEPPGTLVYTGQRGDAQTRVRVFDFAEAHCDDLNVERIEDIATYKARASVTWIDVDGLRDTARVESIGKLFELHALVLEDVVNVEQRPKFEDNGDYCYLVAQMLSYDEAAQEVLIEQVSFVLGGTYLITFQDKPGDVFEPVRNRLRQARGRIRKMGADYLLHALLDAIVDNYFTVLDRLGERVGEMEEALLARPQEKFSASIQALKRQMIFVRKAIWPLREVVLALQRSESPLIRPETEIYLRDLFDHVQQAIEGVDTTREILGDTHDAYLTIVGNRTNAVMKVMALFSAIFMPLTFVTSIFGMNFRYFPELEWKYGFVGVMVFMVVLAAVLLIFFRSRRWL